jgi:hypothetical protein
MWTTRKNVVIPANAGIHERCDAALAAAGMCLRWPSTASVRVGPGFRRDDDVEAGSLRDQHAGITRS